MADLAAQSLPCVLGTVFRERGMFMEQEAILKISFSFHPFIFAIHICPQQCAAVLLCITTGTSFPTGGRTNIQQLDLEVALQEHCSLSPQSQGGIFFFLVQSWISYSIL